MVLTSQLGSYSSATSVAAHRPTLKPRHPSEWSWAHTVERVIRYYNPLPVMDYWRIPQNLTAYRRFDWSVLWRQHNEHRIVLPEIIFAADALWFRGLALLPICISFICYPGTWTVLAASLRADRNLAPRARNFAILLCGVVLGWEGSAVVLSVPFLLQWTLVQFAPLRRSPQLPVFVRRHGAFT